MSQADAIEMGLAAIEHKTNSDLLRAALRAVLPYAESRAEDMLEAAEESEEERRECAAMDRELADKAVAAVDAAKALLASLDAGG